MRFTNQWRGRMASSGEVRWDSSQLCESELLWLYCYPQYSGKPAVLQGESLELSQEWTPSPSVLSALEGSGLSGDGELACDFRGSCVAACAPRCWHCGSLSHWVQRRSGTQRRRRNLGRKVCGLVAMTWRLSRLQRVPPCGVGYRGHIPAHCRAHWGEGIQDDAQTST